MDSWLSWEFWREHLLLASYAAWGFLLFLIFMLGNFPYQDALSGVLAPLGLKLSYQEQHLHFPFGADLLNVRLERVLEPVAMPLLQSEDLKLSPALATLLGRPALNIHADVYNGQLDAIVRRGGDAILADIGFHDLNLERYRLLSELGGGVGGRLSGTASLSFDGPDLATAGGDLNLDASAFILRIGSGFPPILLTDLKGKIRLDHGVVQIAALQGDGPDLKLSAAGSIRLMPDLGDSIAQLSLILQPTPRGRTRFGPFFGLLPHPPNGRPYMLRGPLMSPSFS